MAVITRPDGNSFIVNAYREPLAFTKRHLLVEQIKLLSQQHGDYVRLNKITKQNVEAIFTKEPGYLFAECLWHYFNKPNNLIFCEALKDSLQLVLIVILHGKILLDAKILTTNLTNELLPVLSAKVPFRVVISGNVPLAVDPATPNAVLLPQEQVVSFEQLNHSLVPMLPLLTDSRVLPVTMALQQARLVVNNQMWLIAATALIVIIGIYGIHVMNAVPITRAPIAAPPDPYVAYETALTKPSPQQLLTQLTHYITQFYFIPGWKVGSISFTGQQYQARVTSNGGDLGALAQWATAHHFQYRLTAQGAELTAATTAPPRQKPKNIYPIKNVITDLSDQLDTVFPEKIITIGASQQYGNNTVETQISIKLDKLSPTLLELLAAQLAHLPIVLNSAQIHLESGFIDGDLQLSIWGTA